MLINFNVGILVSKPRDITTTPPHPSLFPPRFSAVFYRIPLRFLLIVPLCVFFTIVPSLRLSAPPSSLRAPHFIPPRPSAVLSCLSKVFYHRAIQSPPPKPPNLELPQKFLYICPPNDIRPA
jgi:hypothetical protein